MRNFFHCYEAIPTLHEWILNYMNDLPAGTSIKTCEWELCLENSYIVDLYVYIFIKYINVIEMLYGVDAPQHK